MPALQRGAAWAEEGLLGALRQSVPQNGRVHLHIIENWRCIAILLERWGWLWFLTFFSDNKKSTHVQLQDAQTEFVGRFSEHMKLQLALGRPICRHLSGILLYTFWRIRREFFEGFFRTLFPTKNEEKKSGDKIHKKSRGCSAKSRP